MLKLWIKSIVEFSTRRAWIVLGIAVVLAGFSVYYTQKKFAINTDIDKLISQDLPWRQRELAFEKAFPQRDESILAVVDAPTSEAATEASAALTRLLSAEPKLFRQVRNTQESPFFVRNGLLFLPTSDVERLGHQLDQAEPLIQIMATDASLRGLTQALSLVLLGVQRHEFPLDDTAAPFNKFSTTLEDVLAGREAYFSWRELVQGKADKSDLRRFIEILPVLDFSELEPGRAATDAIRKAAADLKLKQEFGANVRLTGPVPIADDEFSTLQEGSLVNGIATVLTVLVILWLALHSGRIILAVFVTLALGLSITAAAGLCMVGALNPISIAFAVLFVGIGVDFGIQFSVRYRSERYKVDNLQTDKDDPKTTKGEHLRSALSNAAQRVGAPLTLAAAATAAGFLSFLPTAYRGVSELGEIAGVGMIIAFVMSITVLPALLRLFNPPGEKEPLGFSRFAPIDRFTEKYRMPILVAVGVLVVAGLPLLAKLKFDFNPMNLRSPKVESVATYLDLRSDPATGTSAINLVASSPAAARQAGERLAKVPEVSRVTTLDSYVPDDQEQKLGFIRTAAKSISPDFEDPAVRQPSDAENIEALNLSVEELTKAAGDDNGPGAQAAKRLAQAIAEIARAPKDVRAKAEAVLVAPLKTTLNAVRAALDPEPITEQNLPADLRADWVTPDGRARVEMLPKGDPNDNEVIRNFARAVLEVEPNATGGPISILESGRTVVAAFFQAGAWALISISILLWLTLRRVTDVLLTLIPLLVAGVVTLEVCVLIGLPLNFANIIALPLLLGIGVAFKIYYIMAWRSGQTGLLQSSLTRAVIFSAMTTATAFGSLWLSSHPGTSSMGKLLALSLACTLLAAVFFQPILMGRPRQLREG
jgi:hopanoid biosynthesis associated RND transporter like protein HpnN